MSEKDRLKRRPEGRDQSDARWRKVVRWSLFASVLWVISWLLVGFFSAPNIFELNLNEAGDFWAGMAAPLAFYWLVLGFFQQGKELRLQVEEMRLSVEQFSEQTKIFKKQYILDLRGSQDEQFAQRLQNLQQKIIPEIQTLLSQSSFRTRDGEIISVMSGQNGHTLYSMKFQRFCPQITERLRLIESIDIDPQVLKRVLKPINLIGIENCIKEYDVISESIENGEAPISHALQTSSRVGELIDCLKSLVSLYSSGELS